MVELGCSVLLWVAVVDQGFSRKQMAAILGHAKNNNFSYSCCPWRFLVVAVVYIALFGALVSEMFAPKNVSPLSVVLIVCTVCKESSH